MRFLKLIVLLPFLIMMGCQSEPAEKNIPYEPPKKTDKKLNDVSFNPAVDILFIVDDSGSMWSYQQKLADNAALFVERFFKTKFIDYHIGVTTSSGYKGGKLEEYEGFRYVSRETLGGDVILKNLMNVGTSGSATEEFFSIHVDALSDSLLQGDNKGFYREDAKLAIFVLTDTEDQSTYTVQDAFEFLVDLKDGDEKQLHYVTAFIEQSQAGCSNEGTPPRKLKAMAEEHKDRGYVFDLCQPDYGADLAQVAADLVRAVSTIYLEEVPDVTTIKVIYGDYEIPNDPEKGWVYSPEINALFLSPKIDIRDPEPQELKITFEAIYK